jgi:hypothetical protein
MNSISIYTNPAGDWQALYVNGMLEYELHEVRFTEIKEWCPIESIKEVYLSEMPEDEDFPSLESDIQKDWE